MKRLSFNRWNTLILGNLGTLDILGPAVSGIGKPKNLIRSKMIISTCLAAACPD